MQSVIDECKKAIEVEFQRSLSWKIAFENVDIDVEMEDWPIQNPELTTREIFSSTVFHPGMDRITIKGTICEGTITIYATYILKESKVESVYFDTGGTQV